jgi:hypothetical protein
VTIDPDDPLAAAARTGADDLAAWLRSRGARWASARPASSPANLLARLIAHQDEVLRRSLPGSPDRPSGQPPRSI